MLGASAYSHSGAKLGIQVEMRDGVNLLTDIYLPTGDGPFPVLLCRVPYGTQTDYVFQPSIGLPSQ